MGIPRSSREQKPSHVIDISFLSQVKEVSPPLTEQSPVWLHQKRVTAGPMFPSPQRHPCYEVGIHLTGSGMELVGSEQSFRRPGDILLVAPGIPHWLEATDYPVDFITVFFLPSVLIDLGNDSDSLKILRRLTSPQGIDKQLLRPPRSLQAFFKKTFLEMVKEFNDQRFGREIRLRMYLLEILVELIRWEQDCGQNLGDSESPVDWQRVHVALEYLRIHHRQPIYASDVAKAADVTEAQLIRLFRAALGISWGRYLQGYRIHRAAALLSETNCGVFEAALAVGFETVSHFNATFHAFMGTSPRKYRQKMADSAYEPEPNFKSEPATPREKNKRSSIKIRKNSPQ